jgi:hypothetical protein
MAGLTGDYPMRVVPTMVAYHTGDWIRVAVTSYLHHFPEDRVLVVDNNPARGEIHWAPICERERNWLRSHPRVDYLPNPLVWRPGDTYAPHGFGIDVAVAWCRDHDADVLLHLEPDCVVNGRRWRENLLGALSEGAWMAGSVRKAYGPIHPTPSAWRVDQIRSSFGDGLRTPCESHPRFHEVFDLPKLKEMCSTPREWNFFEKLWDTAERCWFDAAVEGRAAIVETPDFRHYWLGSTQNRCDEATLIERHPELADWFRAAGERKTRRPADCSFRLEVRGHGRDEIARCDFLRQVIDGVSQDEPCDVRRDVCDACCASSPSSLGEWNRVIASLLITFCDRNEKADRVTIAALRERAEAHLEEVTDEPIPPLPLRDSGKCFHLGGPVGFRPAATPEGTERATVYHCDHPAHRETTPMDCLLCRDWSDRGGFQPSPLRKILPVPEYRFGRRVQNWAVGVITSPRLNPTLDTCLDSLKRAGWGSPRLFVDNATSIALRHASLPLTLREPGIGAWPNYYLALAELVLREPEADAYLMVEDDVLFFDREDLRAYLEAILWPSEPIGAVSLYCSSMYTRPSAGWHRFDGEWQWGALAFLFSRESARQFLGDPLVLAHRSRNEEGLADADLLIGRWSAQRELPIYFPTPSLVQHIGETSAIWPSARAFGSRRADQFAGDPGRA